MVEGIPYLPYILKDLTDKVSAALGYGVYFDYGLYADVAKKMKNKVTHSEPGYPLVWLVINTLRIDRSRPDIYGEARFDMILAMPTDEKYTSQERTENVFKARLYPIYDELLKQISECSFFLMPSKNFINHEPLEKHYWGGTESGADAKNLFNTYIDAIHIRGMQLELSQVISEEMNILN
jgi:hypothetical protein